MLPLWYTVSYSKTKPKQYTIRSIIQYICYNQVSVMNPSPVCRCIHMRCSPKSHLQNGKPILILFHPPPIASKTASVCFLAIWKWYEREVHHRPRLWLWEIALTLQCLWEETTWHIPSRKSGQLWGGLRGPLSAFHIHVQGVPCRSGFSSAAL